MLTLRTLLFSLLAIWGGAAAAAEPVATLAAGFQGPFAFRVPDGTTLQATLQLPQGAGPFPLVVVLHGGTGPTVLDAADMADLVPRGYAVAVVDSFTGRGFKAGASGGAGVAIRPPERVPDAYQALRLLATHPQIDAGRAALFGRSHGGTATMVAATTWAQSTHGAGGAAFKAFVALYPTCSVSYPQYEALAGPLRLHLAERDELTPARPCEALVARMAAAGQDASARLYPNAHHAFDSPAPVAYFGQWTNYGACAFTLPTPDVAPPADALKACARRGTSMGGNPQATAQWRQNLAAELAALLAP
ncbi:dienelactone hydrolase family protein [Pseudorhodoferax sp. Leaf267]|uniref:dienelactone hydrolase family protein n=1 Tax=Pseudorhodoferax sp. Leaf267 TaxID=1736316 RepID=UPI0006F6913E|nr:dienelactone hydrolase family protein [Pseudorhodoferax sp. Leaf267]KQP11808.1 hypothetical protein ASF43_22880 [Pseudorhodoferax sp. Leaf267]